MDTTLTEISRQNLVVGYRQVVRGLSGNQLRCVMIASDTDIGIKDKIIALCQDKNIPYRIGMTKQETGKLLGLDVACAIYGTKVTK
ncbi:MAG: ribosomal L7Ae/L30e/S12e/Gadd45 family protein [Clostridiales bacterium]|nr:ribosomal L7Ae/L30e/S12e/Gadd45 family protein [Clostridiales bacterium]